MCSAPRVLLSLFALVATLPACSVDEPLSVPDATSDEAIDTIESFPPPWPCRSEAAAA